MDKNKKKCFGLIFVLLFSLFVAFNPSIKAQPIQLDSNTYFGFNNGWMSFNDIQTFNVMQEIGNYWYFDSVGVSLDGANATVLTWLQNNQIVFNLTDISPICIILIDITALNPSITVSGASSYSVTSGILTITKTGFSIDTVTVNLTPIKVYGFAVSSYTLAQNVPFCLYATVYDESGIINLQSFSLEVSAKYQVKVSWSLGAWTIPFGSANCMLISGGCSVSQTDDYTYVFTFNLKFMGASAETSVDVLSAGTLAVDAYGNSASGSTVNLATYPGAPTQPGGNSNPPPNNNPPVQNQTTPNPPQNQTQPQNNTNTNPVNPTNTTGPFNPPDIPQIPAVTAEIPFSPMYLLAGIVFIFAVVGVTGFYTGRKRKDPLSDAQKLWNKQRGEKSVKWNKDE